MWDFLTNCVNGLNKTKGSINVAFSGFRKVDEELLETLEEVLIMSDVGVETSQKVILELRDRIKRENIRRRRTGKKCFERNIN